MIAQIIPWHLVYFCRETVSPWLTSQCGPQRESQVLNRCLWSECELESLQIATRKGEGQDQL